VRALPRRRTSVLSTAAGAVLGWALLLAWAASQGPVAVVARRVGGILQLPAWGFIVLTLAVPALLAGTAARLVQPARRR
jgi:hypothetical protein